MSKNSDKSTIHELVSEQLCRNHCPIIGHGWEKTVPKEAVNFVLNSGYHRNLIDFGRESLPLDWHAQLQVATVIEVFIGLSETLTNDQLARVTVLKQHIDTTMLANLPSTQV